jgi:O-acetyl-ADP-ribose deacetylase (regulator of RNase III)
MFEVHGNLFAFKADAIVVTTNGDVNKKGLAVMGRGVAWEAKQHYPGIDRVLGTLLKTEGSHVHIVWPESANGSCAVVSFPVKYHWFDEANPQLIDLSCGQLVALTEEKGWSTVALPRPGCGNGKLRWETIRPILVAWLDSRFTIVNDGR